MRSGLKWAARRVVAELCYHARLHKIRHKGKVIILTYHRVVSKEELSCQHIPPGMYVLKEVFEMHMHFLQEHYEMLSFQDLLARWESHEWNREQASCVVTFDDGWLDNYQHAYPILKAHGVPATIFLATDLVGTNEWFWPEKLSYLVERAADADLSSRERAEFVMHLSAYLADGERSGSFLTGSDSELRHDTLGEVVERIKEFPPEKIYELLDQLADVLQVEFPKKRVILNWDEIAEMSCNNIAFGSHSCSHRIMTTLSPHESQREIEQSDRRLQEQHVSRVPVFCYPNGNTNQAIQEQIRTYGYRAAVGTRFGYEGEHPANLFELDRVGIHNDVTSTVPLLAFHMLGPLL